MEIVYYQTLMICEEQNYWVYSLILREEHVLLL